MGVQNCAWSIFKNWKSLCRYLIYKKNWQKFINICNFWIDIYYWKKSQHTYFWWEKLAVFQTRFLKTDHCAPERHRHQSHGYGNGFTKLFNSERWWVWESLCFFLFFQFSLFVFFIQSEKVNVAALQFCNCFHIHSISCQ